MTFVHLFAIGYISFILNFEKVFGIEQAVLFSKSMLLLSAIIATTTRPRITISFWLAWMAVLLVFVTAAFTRFHYFEWINWFRALNNVVVPFFLLSIVPNEKDRDSLLQILAWGPVVSIVAGILYQATGRTTLFGIDNLGGGAQRLQGSLIPAFLAGVALTGALSAFFLTQCRNKRFLWLAIVDLIILLMTAARMPVALAVVMCGYFFLFELNITRTEKVAVLAFSTVAGASFLATFGHTIIDRFSSGGASGRDILWRYLYTVIDRYWGFGVGLGHAGYTIPHAVSVLVGGVVAPHNEFIRLSVELGVIGASLYISIYVLIMLNVWSRAHTGRPVVLLAGLGFLTFCYTDNAFVTPTYYPMLFAVAFWSLCLPPQNKYSMTYVFRKDRKFEIVSRKHNSAQAHRQ
jgi:hypothetical protein